MKNSFILDRIRTSHLKFEDHEDRIHSLQEILGGDPRWRSSLDHRKLNGGDLRLKTVSSPMPGTVRRQKTPFLRETKLRAILQKEMLKFLS